MPFLPSLPETAHLADLFTRFPGNLRPLMEVHDGLLRGDGALSVGERELIAAYVSALNACRFCEGSHKVYAEAFGFDPALIDALLADPATAPVDPALRPLLAYVARLNTLPSRLTDADAAAVFEAGWPEAALWEAVQVCALFNMMNRIVEGTGINFDYATAPGAHPAQGTRPDPDAPAYSHFADRIEAAARGPSRGDG
ncbi:carboxymuconolactone decarboxylase family protein [Roseovarius salinarum]|uniref:carboxymuconolactone decarboxylase family protein n=1 Tax=Roseovarius salinarum TaxID=1981892 RepID=UPI0013001062|nr:peroxidase-related enzyme [Roseovarius salinarum]